MVYDVEFLKDVVKKYAVNIISENIYAKIDLDGHSHGILESMLYFKK